MVESGTLRRHSIWMMYGHGIAVAFQALYFGLIGRTLGSSEYGAFVGVVALINVLSQFSSLGMEMILVRNLSRDQSTFASTWGKAIRLSCYGFVVLLMAALLIRRFTLRAELRALIPYIALSDGLFGKFVQLASRAFQGVSQLGRTAQLIALTNIARAFTALVLFIASHHWRFHANALLWVKVYWFSSSLTAAIALGLVTMAMGWPKFERMSWRELVDGLGFALSNSSISTYNDLAKTFLATMGQLHAAGVYSAAYRVIDVASIPIYSIYAAASPQFFRDGKQGIRKSVPLAHKLLKHAIPYGVILAVGLSLTSPAVPYFFGNTFTESSVVVRWLCLLPLIRGLHYAWGTTITGSSSQWHRTRTQTGAALLNLLLNYLLIPRWSWRGAAIASLVTDGALAASNWITVCWLRSREKTHQIVSKQTA